MRSITEKNKLILFPEGNIDTTNAEQFGQEVDEARQAHPEGSIILNMEDLKYISSAGLRQILRLRKREQDLCIIECSSEIYEIFEMTGFTEMIDITKAFRKVSVENCEVIGEGSNGIVYRLNPDTIIKVYKNNDALEDIKRERELAKKALVLGINTAISFDVVRVGDKFGSVFELLSAQSLTKLITSDPENRDKYIRIFADLLKEIHRTHVKEDILPSAKAAAKDRAEWLNGHIPEEVYEKLNRMISEIPERDTMIHGDYHTSNVHYADGEAILIDMDTLATGDPIFEFAPIFLAYRGFGELDHRQTERFLMVDWDTAGYILDKLLEFYFDDKDDEYRKNVLEKAKVLGYARILRRTIKRTPDQTKLIEHYRDRLIESVGNVDSLQIG